MLFTSSLRRRIKYLYSTKGYEIDSEYVPSQPVSFLYVYFNKGLVMFPGNKWWTYSQN